MADFPDPPSLWVDFQGMLDDETVPLNFNGTVADVERQGLRLRDGLAVRLWDSDWGYDGEPDDLEGWGVVAWDTSMGIWVCRLTTQVLHHSDHDPSPVRPAENGG